MAPLIPAGMRAISVRVNDVVGVAGFVLPGMRVDVLVTGRPTNHPDSVARTVLQNIAVLSAGQTIQSEGKNAINTPVVTLLVTPEDAESLTLANSDGHIQLVLRNSVDAGLGSTRGRQWSDLYATRAPERPATSPAAAPREPRERPPHSGQSPAPEIARLPAPVPVEQVVVIRGNVKTVEPAVNGGGK